MRIDRLLCLRVLKAYAKYNSEVLVAQNLKLTRSTVQSARRKAAKEGWTVETSEDLAAPEVSVLRLQEQLKTLRTSLVSIERDNLTSENVRRVILGLSEQPLEPPKWVVKPTKSSHAVVPVLTASDWHMGEVIDPNAVNGINQFDLETAVQRIKRLVDTTLRLCFDERRHNDYPCLVLNLGGDMVTGDIHEELALTNELETMPVALYTAELIVEMIRTLRANGFKKIFVPGTMGNHGRNTKKVRHKRRAYSNWDWLITSLVERFMQHDKDVRFFSPAAVDTRYEVMGHPCTLTHGDATGARGGDGHIGSVGPIVRGEMKMRRNAATVQHPHRFVFQGHWHTTMRVKNLIQNGCLVGYNEYAKNELGADPEPPSQTLVFLAEQYGLISDHTIYVEPKQVLYPASDAPMVAWMPDGITRQMPRLTTL